MKFVTTIACALVAHAGTSGASGAKKPRCIEKNVSIDIKAQSFPVLLPPIGDQYQATNYLFQTVRRDAAPASAALGKPVELDKSYSISIQYCPSKGQSYSQKVTQILTHGLGSDKSYWDFGNKTYNYVQAATAAGYSTLSYDRLGVGKSDKPDPYNEIQTPIQVAILARLTELLKSGKLDPKIPAPEKVVHVGHSFGSLLSNLLVTSKPELSDAIVLTGFTYNGSWTTTLPIASGFTIANLENPKRFKGYDNGFLTWGGIQYNQFSFLTYPNFDKSVLDKTEKEKQPFSFGELITFLTAELPAPNFRGPVQMLNGENDILFCGGNCDGIVDGPYAISRKFIFPNAAVFETYLQPATGHSINYHYNASASYEVTFEFLRRQGL